jgi:hypothetical protein
MQKQINEMSRDELLALVGQLKAAKQTRLTMKVSKAGAVSIYGMGRWPTTLYRGQWERILENAEELKAFIEAHASLLSTGKDDPRFERAE